MISRSLARQKVAELISNPNLVKHCLAVEAAMGRYADYFNIGDEEKEKWLAAGLLHDADYEKHPDQHPKVILAWLKENGANEELLNAIAAHGFEFGIKPKSLMAKTLRAVDELTGLIVAVALVRKSRKLADVSVESILKKWKDKTFARGVRRGDIERGAEEINVPLKKHLEIVLAAMREIAPKLGL